MTKTPMERQYEALKAEANDALLFFRVGEFYEMFHEDAQKASEILDIALTSRNKNAENPTPMCGVPVKSAERYIAKLTQAGQKIAIAEQVSDPSLPGIVERKIISLITPGTTLSDHILEAKKNNIIASIYHETNISCAALADISTGEIEIYIDEHIDEIQRFLCKKQVVEIVFTPQSFSEFSKSFSYFSGVTTRFFIPENPTEFLQKFFGVKTLKGFGIEQNIIIQKSLSLLLAYLQETQKTPLVHFSTLKKYEKNQSMHMDPSTISNLEIFTGTDGHVKHGLLHCIDNTKTAMGGRLMYQYFLNPLQDKEMIENRLDMTEWLLKNPNFLQDIENILKNISDIERIVGKIAMKKANPQDAIRLSASLDAIKNYIPMLLDIPEESPWKSWADEIIQTMS